MSKSWGYARVSTEDQDLSVQIADLVAAGVPEPLVFAEKKSGASREGRVELDRLLAIASEGDVVHVCRIDRLARSMVDFANIVADLKKRGIGLRVVKQGIDTTVGGPVGELTMNLLAAFASFETQIRRERQMEGIERAKAEGAYKGRAKKTDDERIRMLRAGGMRPADIQRELGVSKSSVFRALRGPLEQEVAQ